MESFLQQRIEIENNDEAINLLGQQDKNFRLIESEFGVRLHLRDNTILIEGEEEGVIKTSYFLNEALKHLRERQIITPGEIKYALKLMKDFHSKEDKLSLFSDSILITNRGKHIKARTLGQRKYVEAIKKYDMVFGIGPAGTGKTYLAVAMALLALKEKLVSRIIITRPAVEAGERLGFLPGDLQEKVNPYLRPIYDALYDMIEHERFQRLMERGTIEVAPLAYMRGRSLNDAFIILDEAQNTTHEQMKMALTRLGFGSRIVITGDITQIDLPQGKFSGLLEARDILSGIPGIVFIYFTEEDVVRHDLVKKIILAYDKFEGEQDN